MSMTFTTSDMNILYTIGAEIFLEQGKSCSNIAVIRLKTVVLNSQDPLCFMTQTAMKNWVVEATSLCFPAPAGTLLSTHLFICSYIESRVLVGNFVFFFKRF